MITLFCALMAVVGCSVVFFEKKTIGLLSVAKMHKLNALVCAKNMMSVTPNRGDNENIYPCYTDRYRASTPSDGQWRGFLIQPLCRHSHSVSAQVKSIEGTDVRVVLGLFRASWIENCLLACKSRVKLIHDRGRLAPRLSGGIHLTMLTTR